MLPSVQQGVVRPHYKGGPPLCSQEKWNFRASVGPGRMLPTLTGGPRLPQTTGQSDAQLSFLPVTLAGTLGVRQSQPQDILCSIPSFLWFHGGQRIWTWRNSFGFSGQCWFRGRSLAPCFLRERQMMPRPESHLVGTRDWGVHRWPDVLHASVAGTTVERLVGYLGYLG